MVYLVGYLRDYWLEIVTTQTSINMPYYIQLEHFEEWLKQKRASLINRVDVRFHHENYKPHTIAFTQRKIAELG